MTLLLDSVDLVQVVLVVPMLVGTAKEADAFNVPSLLVEREDDQLVDRNVGVLQERTQSCSAFEGGYVSRRGPHIHRQRSAIKIEEPLANVHRVPRCPLLPADLVTSSRIRSDLLTWSKDLFEHVVPEFEH